MNREKERFNFIPGVTSASAAEKVSSIGKSLPGDVKLTDLQFAGNIAAPPMSDPIIRDWYQFKMAQLTNKERTVMVNSLNFAIWKAGLLTVESLRQATMEDLMNSGVGPTRSRFLKDAF